MHTCHWCCELLYKNIPLQWFNSAWLYNSVESLLSSLHHISLQERMTSCRQIHSFVLFELVIACSKIELYFFSDSSKTALMFSQNSKNRNKIKYFYRSKHIFPFIRRPYHTSMGCTTISLLVIKFNVMYALYYFALKIF